MQIIAWAFAGVVGLAALFVAVQCYGAWRWAGTTRELVARLNAGRVATSAASYNTAEIADLPAPVKRFFCAALTDGQQIVTQVTIVQTGMFNVSATAVLWKPFTATQHFTTRRRGFVWNAKIMMLPGVPVRVVDAYIAGKGLLRPALFGLYDMGILEGEGEIARGELFRYLAESVWYPTALLPSQGGIWSPVDEASATVTLTDGPISVTMLVRFCPDGLISAIRVEARATTVGNAAVMMPWECRMSNYQAHDGMHLPMTGEALYITPQGERPYFKGTIGTLAFAFASHSPT